MITLEKDGGIKTLDNESKLIPILLADGWKEQKAPKKEVKTSKKEK